ncbi:MAG TPA: MFS transporter, partial [Acetobacteraceae bacterium]|nr:MFS transporter [Acetobacteraceae bacterium]
LPPARVHAAPPLRFRGWLVVAGAFAVLMVAFGAAYSFAAFATALGDEFGASRAHVSLVFVLGGFTTFTVSALTGPLADRVGPRPLAVTGMLLVALGLLTAAAAATLTEVILCYGLVIGLGVGFAYVPATAAVQRWFTVWRGLASGIAAAGIGFGTALVGPAAGLLAGFGDWRTAFMLSALGVAAVGVAGALLLDPMPEARGLAPDGAASIPPRAGAPIPEAGGPRLRAALLSRDFALLYGGTLLLSIPVALPFAHLVHAAQDAGLPRTEALALLSILGIGSIAGRCILGALADGIGRRATFLLCCAGIAAMTALWAMADAGLLIAFALGFGLFYGGFVALLPAFAADRFGRRDAAGVIGVLYTGRGNALLVAAPLLALLGEGLAGYAVPLLIAALLGATGVAMVAMTGAARRGG